MPIKIITVRAAALLNCKVVKPPDIYMDRAKMVLVIDDNIDAADMTAEVLRMHDISAVAAYGGVEGLAMAQALMPSVIFLDIGMPFMDGCAVASALRKDEAFQKVKLVALTAWGDQEICERIKAAGFDLHLTKPALLATLIEVAQ